MIFKNATIIVDQTDLSGSQTSISFEGERSELDVTNFRSPGFKEFQAGKMGLSGSFSGFWEPSVDKLLHDLGGDSANLIIAPSADAGSRTWQIPAVFTNYSIGESVDEMINISGSFVTASPGTLTLGQILYSPENIIDGEHFGTSFELGATSAVNTKTFTFVNISDEDVDVTIQSSATAGWASPDDEDTVTVAAGTTEVLILNSTISNTHYRVKVESTDPAQLIAILHS